MISLQQGFFGSDAGMTLEFVGSDQQHSLEKNLKTQPDSWYYRTHKITYSYNSLGHRCKNIEDIDLDNYLLFTGCSHTEGVGLELEKTYPYLVADMLGCDYYNLAVGGSGIDVLTHNLTMWQKRVSKKPKAVVILWPHETRFVTKNKDQIFLNLGTDTNYTTKRFILAGEDIDFFSSRKQFSESLIVNLYDDSKIINAGWHNYPKGYYPSLITTDVARDLTHSGIESNEKFAAELAKLLN